MALELELELGYVERCNIVSCSTDSLCGSSRCIQAEELRSKLEKEKEEEMASLRAELEERMKEEQQTWEERLRQTTANMGVNDAALAALGAATGAADDEAREKAKTVPHMANLNQDPQLSGQILHFFEQGAELKIGSAAETQDVVLRGLSIMKEHCIINNSADTVTLKPHAGAKVCTNFIPCTASTHAHTHIADLAQWSAIGWRHGAAAQRPTHPGLR